MPTAVEIQGLCKSFRRGAHVNHVLRDVELKISQGECVVLTGPSGCGKTTLLSILGCTLTADAGTIRLFDRDVSRLRAHELEAVRRETIGFLFQRFHLIRGLSALDNVYLPLVLNGVRRKVARQRATEQLHSVGLADLLHADPRQMSVGQCQRVALARALASDPDLILADEPTASLDAANGEAVMELLRELTKQQGRTAVIVTHDPRVERFADRTVHMEDGRMSEVSQATLSRSIESDRHFDSPRHEATYATVASLSTNRDSWNT